MIIVKPDIVSTTTLTASNVGIGEYSDWAAGSYGAGNRVRYQPAGEPFVLVYESLVTTTDRPDDGVAANPPTWARVGAVNRFKMFDSTTSSQTESAGVIDLTVTPTAPYDALVLLGVEGSSVQLIVRDGGGVVRYDETRSLADYSNVTGFYSYFFGELPLDAQAAVTFLDIPNYTSATYRLIILKAGGTAKCAEAVFGRASELAVTNFGSSVGIKDYSVKRVDDFGNVQIIERPFSKRANFDLKIETNEVGVFNRFMASLRATPVVYIGDEGREETIIFGYYRDFNVVLSGPSISTCSLEIEGLT